MPAPVLPPSTTGSAGGLRQMPLCKVVEKSKDKSAAGVWLSRSGAEAAPPLEAEWRLRAGRAGQGRAWRGVGEETKRAAPASFLGIVATLAWLLGWAELRASSEPLSIRLNLDGSDSVTRGHPRHPLADLTPPRRIVKLSLLLFLVAFVVVVTIIILHFDTLRLSYTPPPPPPQQLASTAPPRIASTQLDIQSQGLPGQDAPLPLALARARNPCHTSSSPTLVLLPPPTPPPLSTSTATSRPSPSSARVYTTQLLSLYSASSPRSSSHVHRQYRLCDSADPSHPLASIIVGSKSLSKLSPQRSQLNLTRTQHT
ncbi:DNA polymerase iota [Moesziomyces antarcticus T-34]|uniref:DNA polymerase iota n=1 Tax=Pseudozyma antarctica (strain T-34) TaxID=1151754 RepID=M9LTW2_PSEA3|nr:DNA polymerase iota [Moesziomyces antarcticus T-34]